MGIGMSPTSTGAPSPSAALALASPASPTNAQPAQTAPVQPSMPNYKPLMLSSDIHRQSIRNPIFPIPRSPTHPHEMANGKSVDDGTGTRQPPSAGSLGGAPNAQYKPPGSSIRTQPLPPSDSLDNISEPRSTVSGDSKAESTPSGQAVTVDDVYQLLNQIRQDIPTRKDFDEFFARIKAVEVKVDALGTTVGAGNISVRTQDGTDVDPVENSLSPVIAHTTSPQKKLPVAMRMETVEAKNKRLAAEAKKGKKAAAEEKRLEEERVRQVAKREEEERRIRKEEEEKEHQEEETERDRLQLEEEEKLKKAEEARLQRKLLEAAEKAKKKEAEEGEIIAQEAAKSGGEGCRIDTTLPSHEARRRPGPLRLPGTVKAIVQPPPPSALAAAKVIEDLGRVPYPEGISSPKVELNVNAKKGKFKYDRDFLLQFRAVCKERPDALPALDTIGLEPSDQTSPPISHGSGKRTTSTSGMPPLLSSQVSVGLGISCFKFNNFSMGNFSTPSGKMTSEERFAMPQGCTVSTSCAINTSGLPFGKPAAMIRTSGGGPDGADRTRSKRGEKRTDDGGVNNSYSQQKAPASGLELAAFLEPTADRWTRQVPTADTHSPEVVDRKVKSLLNKLTMEKFDSVSDQIIAWANKSEKEKDGRTLVQVIRLVFEKAIDEAAWSEMYARLCRKMMERISPDVQDDGIENSDGKPIAGGQLFRKYLLNRCQDDFERGWAAKDAAASSAASGASGGTGPYSEEYYTARKARRQGLGLIQFIGELYKLQMLTERIMHECIKKLLGNVDKPEEEEIESLCRLLTTVGTLLDNVKARAHMDIYFSRMRELIKSSDVSSRMHFLLLELIELRGRKWVPCNQVAAPTTIAAIHEAAARKETSNRTLSTSRGGGEYAQGGDGWSVAGGNVPRPQPKAEDLLNFGKINKAAAKARPGIRGTSVDLGQRQDLQLLRPRPEAALAMSKEQANKKISEYLKDLFSIRDVDESEDYFAIFPAEHKFRLVGKMVSIAIESKESDAQLVADAFRRAVEKNLCSARAFEAGFIPTAEILDEIAIDVPMAFNLMAIMMKGASLGKKRRLRIADKLMDNSVLLSLF